jgi:hypothetical protein
MSTEGAAQFKICMPLECRAFSAQYLSAFNPEISGSAWAGAVQTAADRTTNSKTAIIESIFMIPPKS